MTMTEEEFRAQMGLGTPGTGTATANQPIAVPNVSTNPVPPPVPVMPAPIVPAPVGALHPPQGGGWHGKKPGVSFSPVKLPLVVRQAKKDGRFYLAGNISFAVEVDQQMFQRISETGQGLNEFKAGEIIVWPPFDKTKQRG